MVAALNPHVVARNNRLTARCTRRDQQLAEQRVNRAIQRRRRRPYAGLDYTGFKQDIVHLQSIDTRIWRASLEPGRMNLCISVKIQ